jgi:protein-tyrosine phosphatase
MSAPRLLLLCMGNICRSPMAEGILRARARQAGQVLHLDSAGTHDSHRGQAPDPRARRVAAGRGAPIDDLRARRIEAADFARFDHVLVADRDNLAALQQRFGSAARAAQLLLPFAGVAPETEVPDPYYGDERDFEAVADLLERAAAGILQRLAKPA